MRKRCRGIDSSTSAAYHTERFGPSAHTRFPETEIALGTKNRRGSRRPHGIVLGTHHSACTSKKGGRFTCNSNQTHHSNNIPQQEQQRRWRIDSATTEWITSTARSFPSLVLTIGGRLTSIFRCSRSNPAASSYLRRASPAGRGDTGLRV